MKKLLAGILALGIAFGGFGILGDPPIGGDSVIEAGDPPIGGDSVEPTDV